MMIWFHAFLYLIKDIFSPQVSILNINMPFSNISLNNLGQKGDNSDVVIWDYNQKKAIYRLSEHDHAVSHLAFSHDDKLLISVGS